MTPAKSHSAVAEGLGRTARGHGCPPLQEGVTSPTDVARCNWRRCLLRTEVVFEWEQVSASHPLSRLADGDAFSAVGVLLFLFCSASAYDQMPPAPHTPRAAAAVEEATHTSRAALRPGTAAVVKISAGLETRSTDGAMSVAHTPPPDVHIGLSVS